jgi:hypothetical protein
VRRELADAIRPLIATADRSPTFWSQCAGRRPKRTRLRSCSPDNETAERRQPSIAQRRNRRLDRPPLLVGVYV